MQAIVDALKNIIWTIVNKPAPKKIHKIWQQNSAPLIENREERLVCLKLCFYPELWNKIQQELKIHSNLPFSIPSAKYILWLIISNRTRGMENTKINLLLKVQRQQQKTLPELSHSHDNHMMGTKKVPDKLSPASLGKEAPVLWRWIEHLRKLFQKDLKNLLTWYLNLSQTLSGSTRRPPAYHLVFQSTSFMPCQLCSSLKVTPSFVFLIFSYEAQWSYWPLLNLEDDQ